MHRVSSVAEQAASCVAPSGQTLQAAHTRSELAVGATSSHMPAPHCVSGAQERSEVGVSGVAAYSCAVHSVLTVHAPEPDSGLNVSAGQPTHWRSLVDVGATLCVWPGPHAVARRQSVLCPASGL